MNNRHTVEELATYSDMGLVSRERGLKPLCWFQYLVMSVQ